MKKAMTIAVALILLMTLLAAEDALWKTFEDAKNGYSVELPSGWEQGMDEESGDFTATYEGDGIFPVSITLVVEPLSGEKNKLDFEEVARISREAVEIEFKELGFTELKFLDTGTTTLGGQKAFIIDISALLLELFNLRIKIISTIHDGKLYAISFSAHLPEYGDYSDVFDHVLASYRFGGSR